MLMKILKLIAVTQTMIFIEHLWLYAPAVTYVANMTITVSDG